MHLCISASILVIICRSILSTCLISSYFKNNLEKTLKQYGSSSASMCMESSVKPSCLVGVLLVLVAGMLENHSAGSLMELNVL